MTCTAEQLAANRKNASKSCGPKTDEGKEISRRNSYKHGLTGEGVVVSEADAVAATELAVKFHAELKPSTAVSKVLVDRMARMAVRLDRCAVHESSMIQARAEAGEDLDTFDSSREAILAWKYELAAERGFFRALREVRKIEAKASQDGASHYVKQASRQMASSLKAMEQAEARAARPAPAPTAKPVPAPIPQPSPLIDFGRAPGYPSLPTNCVAFSIGKKP